MYVGQQCIVWVQIDKWFGYVVSQFGCVVCMCYGVLLVVYMVCVEDEWIFVICCMCGCMGGCWYEMCVVIGVGEMVIVEEVCFVVVGCCDRLLYW